MLLQAAAVNAAVRPLQHPHSDSVSTASPTQLDTPTQHHDIFEMSVGSHVKSQDEEVFTSSNPDPTTSDLVTSDPANPSPSDSTIPSASAPVPTIPNPVTSSPAQGGHLIASRSEGKKMSRKEKKFHLSKDDGKYAELNPINPLEARKEYGDTLRLNPVGPAVGGVASLQEGTTSHVPGPRESECLPCPVIMPCPTVGDVSYYE